MKPQEILHRYKRSLSKLSDRLGLLEHDFRIPTIEKSLSHENSEVSLFDNENEDNAIDLDDLEYWIDEGEQTLYSKNLKIQAILQYS